MKTYDPVNIAVLRRNGYGDLVCAMPVINYLKEKYPNNKMYIFVSERNYALTPYLLPNDNVVMIKAGNKYLQAIKVALKYRSVGFSLGVSPFPDYVKLNNLFLQLLKAKQIYSRKKHDPFGNTLANSELHVALASLKLVDAKIDKIAKKWYPRINSSLIPQVKVNLPNQKIFVSITNNRPTSQLSEVNLCNLLNNLFIEQPFSVILSCSKLELADAQKLKNKLKMPCEAYVTDNFGEFLGLLNNSDLVLGGDGGVCHLAACLEKKIVALYGFTSVERWGVLSDKAIHFFDQQDVNNIDLKDIKTALASFLCVG